MAIGIFRRNKVIWVWNNMRMSKLQNFFIFDYGVNYSFSLGVCGTKYVMLGTLLFTFPEKEYLRLLIRVLLWKISHNSKAHSDKFSVSCSSVTRTVPVQYLEGDSECWSMYLISDYHNHHSLNYSDRTFPWGPQSGQPLVNHVLWSLPGHRAAEVFFFFFFVFPCVWRNHISGKWEAKWKRFPCFCAVTQKILSPFDSW